MNNIKTVGLMAFLGAIFVLVGQALGGTNGAVIALIFVGGLNFAMYFFSDRIALASAGARPVTEQELPQVYAIVRSLTEREGMPMPKIHLIDAPQPNAFATGRSPSHAAVAVTTGILQMMEYDELEGVLAHEVAHIGNGDMVTMTLLQGVINAFVMFLARLIAYAVVRSSDSRNGYMLQFVVMMVLQVVLGILGSLVTARFSRYREFRADAGGAHLAGRENMIAALKRLMTNRAMVETHHEALATLKIHGRRSWGMLFSTHPPLEQRIAALEAARS